ncbi:IPT/TIG domain-containing protein [Dinghuibacter silviterrae]|uniref:IPT/TIG domain-containing protein n=1 Tax=Dinghuibacter silviterrae TaxID=1539049 RepID=A0A4R8DFH5_9BACT|nr:IPT/TIG domain-containing protein [Dinghuibacter silviterrae]TDW95836.1 IPT/TIG domain-containing protein [Dinghuibacter silviterrae]
MFRPIKIPAIILITFISACQKSNGIPATLSVSPAIDTIGGIITITGSSFSTNATADVVQFNDTTNAQVLTATSTQLTVVVPYYTARDRITIQVNGRQWQTAQEFQIAPKFTPQAEAPGYPITIITGGSTTLSDYSVSFNGATATPSNLFMSFMTVAVPTGATSGKVTVNFKNQPYTSLSDFTVTPVGEVTNLTATGAFQTPAGMTFDKNGNLYVSDPPAGVIDKVDPNSGTVTTYAGNGMFSFGGGSPILSAGIYGAWNLAFGPDGNLYATDRFYGIVFKITADSVTSLLPMGGPAGIALSSPVGIAFDGSGDLLLSDAERIKMVSPSGSVSILAGTGLQGIVNGPAASAGFSYPTALQLDGSGNVYICDNNMIRLLSNGSVSTFAGGGGNGGFQDGVGTFAGFTSVNDLVRDPKSGNIYVTDPGDHVVRMIAPNGLVTTIAGKIGVQGTQNGTGSGALFEGPSGIAMDKNGVIYVSDGSGATSSIRKIIVH